MERAMKYLEGTHSFKAFTKSDDDREDYVRTLSQTNLLRDLKDVNKITLVFIGTGFMRYMVRLIVGTLVEVGLGKIEPLEISKLLTPIKRNVVSYKAPACGLYLEKVIY